MQEYGWLHWDDFRDMVGIIETIPNNSRRVRLAACAIIRRAWDLLEDSRCRRAVELAEEYADFRTTRQQMKAARKAAEAAVQHTRKPFTHRRDLEADLLGFNPNPSPQWMRVEMSDLPAVRVAQLAELVARPANLNASLLPGLGETVWNALHADRTKCREEQFAQCILLRDVFGNPFRPVAFDPAWRTDTAVALARGMYGSRDFSAMPILADALQDAGCENDDLLAHCRDAKQVHVRGCWVVDLVLGKA
jgi:hypothetical protein